MTVNEDDLDDLYLDRWYSLRFTDPEAYAAHCNARRRRKQEASVGDARRHGKPWTETELIQVRTSGDLLATAKRLGRTYGACVGMRQRLRKKGET